MEVEHNNVPEKDVPGAPQEPEVPEFKIEVVDDTPEEDRGRKPAPPLSDKDVSEDDLDSYDAKVAARIKKLTKGYHDERRRAEAAEREAAAAVEFAKKLKEKAQHFGNTLKDGSKMFIETSREAAKARYEKATNDFRVAFEAGNTDKVLEAQEALTSAKLALIEAERMRPLQDSEVEVDFEPKLAPTNQRREEFAAEDEIEPSESAKQWAAKNKWYGVNKAATAYALGYHSELVEQYGPEFLDTPEYYEAIDARMREKFPEVIGSRETDNSGGGSQQRKQPRSVVAPATRSSTVRTVVLTKTEAKMARKLGLTNEQYASEKLKLQNKGY